MNRQLNDIGTEYRSAIFYADDEQKRVAEDNGLGHMKAATSSRVAPDVRSFVNRLEHQA